MTRLLLLIATALAVATPGLADELGACEVRDRTGRITESAIEELTVDGSGEAAHHSAQRARFESQMNAYGRAVGEEFRRLLEDELVERVCGQRRLAALGTRSRG